MPRATPPPLSLPEIAALRLHTLGLAGDPRPARTPSAVVVHHLAMQAQDFRASRWAIGSRLDGAVDADVMAAYDRGEIVRSWPMRGTVHAVAALDLPWMLEHLGPRALTGLASRWAHLGIGQDLLERARSVAIDRLQGGGRATRSELAAAFEAEGLHVSGQRLYHTVWYLSQTGTLVQGPTRNGEHELVLLEEWIPPSRTLSREAALAELARRYLTARGPVTIEDLVHWTKLTRTDARRAFDLCGHEIVSVEGPGGPYRMLASHLELRTPVEKVVREGGQGTYALAAFDEHLLGYRVRDAVLDPNHATLVDPGRNGVFRWTLVLDGRVAGTWSRTRRSRYTRIEITPFRPLARKARDAAETALAAWGRFAGSDIDVRWAAPSPGGRRKPAAS